MVLLVTVDFIQLRYSIYGGLYLEFAVDTELFQSKRVVQFFCFDLVS